MIDLPLSGTFIFAAGGNAMDRKLNINKVEQLTGVSKRNIRFYEKEGLLTPERNQQNGYRSYAESDIRRIQLIKMLRMLDMPLGEIKQILDEETVFHEAIQNHQTRLEEKLQEVRAAILFCDYLKDKEIEDLDVEHCFVQMDRLGASGLFDAWKKDYKIVVEENRDRDFTFIPNGAVTNPREFTDELCAYAKQQGLDIFITKESMYPEFTLNGVAYMADRYYTSVQRAPVAYIHCTRVNREISGNMDNKRKRFLWYVHKYWVVLVLGVIDVIGIWKWYHTLYTSPEEWVIPIAAIGVQIGGLYQYYLFHYNEKDY